MSEKPCPECGCLPSDTWGCGCSNEDCPCYEPEDGDGAESGGTIPVASRDDDSVSAILSRGCPVLSREQAEAMGLTADAKRLPPEAEVSKEFKRLAAGIYDDDPDLKENER